MRSSFWRQARLDEQLRKHARDAECAATDGKKKANGGEAAAWLGAVKAKDKEFADRVAGKQLGATKDETQAPPHAPYPLRHRSTPSAHHTAGWHRWGAAAPRTTQ